MSFDGCTARVPDHTDYMNCGKSVYLRDLCREHWAAEIVRIRKELREAITRTVELNQALEWLGVGPGSKCEAARPGHVTGMCAKPVDCPEYGLLCEEHRKERIQEQLTAMATLETSIAGAKARLRELGHKIDEGRK